MRETLRDSSRLRHAVDAIININEYMRYINPQKRSRAAGLPVTIYELRDYAEKHPGKPTEWV